MVDVGELSAVQGVILPMGAHGSAVLCGIVALKLRRKSMKWLPFEASWKS